jgi:hypothetical protein
VSDQITSGRCVCQAGQVAGHCQVPCIVRLTALCHVEEASGSMCLYRYLHIGLVMDLGKNLEHGTLLSLSASLDGEARF